MDDNANVLIESPEDTTVNEEQTWSDRPLLEKTNGLQKSFHEFQTWLADTVKAIDDQDLRHLDGFCSNEIEVRREYFQTLKEDIDGCKRTEINMISLQYQHLLSTHPNHVGYLATDLRRTRKAFGSLLIDIAKQTALTESLMPLARDWETGRDSVTEFLAYASDRSRVFLNFGRNNDSVMEFEEEAKRILSEFNEKLPSRDVYVTSSESIVDLAPGADWMALENESTELCRLWEDLLAFFKDFLSRATSIKNNKENSKQKEADRIDNQLRREARQCCCSKPFKIVRLSEGKYTFGDSRIARLVRIHGSSVVVRIGGGWQFLMEFLVRNDPCRANILAEANLDAVGALGLIPTGPSSNSFSLEITRPQRLSTTDEKSRIHCRRSSSSEIKRSQRRNSYEDVSLSGSRESFDSSSLSGRDSNSLSPRDHCDTTTPTKRRQVNRHHSDIPSHSLCSNNGCLSVDSATAKRGSGDGKGTCRRVSLVDRQNEYAAKRRSLNANFKAMDIKP